MKSPESKKRRSFFYFFCLNHFFELPYAERSFKRETKILFIIFCALLIVYGMSFLIRPSGTAVFSSSIISAQDSSEVQDIIFSIPIKAEPVEMGKMRLSKKDGRFYLHTAFGYYPVRQEIIDRFLSVLSVKRSFLTVSKQPKHYADYAIDDSRASRITLERHDKTILADIFFGMTDAAGIGRYVRTGRSVKVFLVDDAVEPFLTVAAPFWLDLQIYAALFRGTSIQGLEYGRYIGIRDEKSEVDFRALETFLEKFSCIDIYSAAPLQSPQTMRVHLTLGDGSGLTLSFTPLQNGDYVFFDSRSSNAYLISGYTCTQLLHRLDAISGNQRSAMPG